MFPECIFQESQISKSIMKYNLPDKAIKQPRGGTFPRIRVSSLCGHSSPADDSVRLSLSESPKVGGLY